MLKYNIDIDIDDNILYIFTTSILIFLLYDVYHID